MSVTQKEISSLPIDKTLPNYIPIRILEIELEQPLPTLFAFDEKKECSYQRARCLVRLHTQPLGLVDLTFARDSLTPDEYIPLIWQALSEQINAHLQEDRLPEVTQLHAIGLLSPYTPNCIVEREAFLQEAPFASVIVPTRDRPEQLAICLRSLLALHYPNYEVIVVDNAPTTEGTSELVNGLAENCSCLRYVRDDHPGSFWARNRGILEAKGKIIAFTDDDVVVDANWLAGLARGFEAAENVACVTGLILPLELDVPAQFLFETFGGFTRGFRRRIFDLREHRWNKPAFPYIVGICGTGASMAFTADFLQSDGGFDPALGVGTPTYGGGDPAAFVSVLIHGYRLVYEPTSLLYHQHRKNYAALQKQIYSYGVGLTAYLTKIIIDHPLLLFDYINKFVHTLWFLAHERLLRPEEEVISLPPELKRLGRKGYLLGPFAYIQSRWAVGWARKGLALAQEGASSTNARISDGSTSK